MDRWDEGSWAYDPIRHGRFTAIEDQRKNGHHKAKTKDVLLVIPTILYSAQDAKISITNWLFFKRYINRQSRIKSMILGLTE